MGEEPEDKPRESPKIDPEQVLGKALLAEYREITNHSKKEIDWVRSSYKYVAFLAAGTVVTVVTVGFRSISDFTSRLEQSASFRMKAIEEKVDATVESKIAAATNLVEDRIDREFRQDNIRALVEMKAQERIDVIADPLIEKRVDEAVEPKIARAEEQLRAVSMELAKAKMTVEQLESLTAFMSLVSDAQNDDRKAYDRLRIIGDDEKSPHYLKARSAYLKIREQHSSGMFQSYKLQSLGGQDPAKASFEDFQREIGKVDARARAAIVLHVSDRADFSKKKKLEFFAELIEQDENLNVVEFAGRFFVKEAGLTGSHMESEKILEWWKRNKETVK